MSRSVRETDVRGVKQYHPATFLERGVAVPFTTPLLCGTRARPTERGGIELVTPNPSGGRGVYIMSWSSASSLCRPTLHDKVFNERIASLVSVTPAAIRGVARALAAEGLAGEEAMEAGLAATNLDKKDRVVTNYRLLMKLVEQIAQAKAPPFTTAGPNAPDAASQARLSVEWVAPRVGRSTTWMATALEDLAEVMTAIGFGTTDTNARILRLITLLQQTRLGVAEWSGAHPEDELAAYGHAICTLADLTLSLAGTLLTAAQALMTDMVDMLRRWAADPTRIIQLTGRPDWLLDGWEQICQIWTHAQDHATRRAALVEIVGLLPVLPKEVNEWCSDVPSLTNALQFRRLIPLNEDWRTGEVVHQLIARNEHFRALSY
ncbi:hypothetical protein [Rhodopila sp.]|uniref:hypothetical protein n=1 Tax=Rhodopila sp. TaxID=2480087 RepID=UPI003D134126